MQEQALRDTLGTIASGAVPETLDLWPAISSRLVDRTHAARRRPDGRRLGLAVAAALVLVIGVTLVRPTLFGDSSTAQAAEIARHDPQVEAILRGDIAIVTVTSVVNDIATVEVGDSHGRRVSVTVDLRTRIVTRVYQGPQLSAELTAQALRVVQAYSRTSAILARGATIGRITPIITTYESTDPTTGQPTQGSETWAQVPLELAGQSWMAYVDLPQGRIDQLIDPSGSQVPLP